MCGIGGILFSKYRPEVLYNKLYRLADKQQHRGPDGRSEKIWNNHGLCHQRLALIDAAHGSQPFTDNSGRYTIVYNGEVYNYLKLRKQLEQHYQFKTNCDTEVVLASYILWGKDCVRYFDGMFAFLIWDEHTQTAFAARDAMGVKPFVYSQQTEGFFFASEVKALLPVLDSYATINEIALSEYILAPYLSSDAISIFRQITYLQPGHSMQINEAGITMERWYRFNWRQTAIAEETLKAATSKALRQSVQLSLHADNPVGIFLSGGLDSSVLAAIAASELSYAPQGYSICFEEHHQIEFDATTIVNSDDLPYAMALAEQLGMPLQKVTAQHDSLESSLYLLSYINDRIPAWEQEFSQHFLSKAAAKKLKAVLVGDAADETNYGYFFLLNETVNHSPIGLLQRFGANGRLQLLAPQLQQRLQPLEYLDDHYRQLAAAAGFQFGKGEEENILAMSTLVHQRWLPRLLHNGDIHTMHFGLEARVPFANRVVLDTVNQVLPASGFKQGQEKYIVRQAASQWLDEKFYNRKKSALPRDPRLGACYQSILHQLLQEKNEFIDYYLNRKALETLCFLPDVTENDRMQLFNMICLINWSKHYVR